MGAFALRRLSFARLAGVGVLLLGLGLLCVPAASAAVTTTTVSYTTPGMYTFMVPAGVTSVQATVTGGAGGACGEAAGGRGATESATVPVSPGAELSIGVGGDGGACVSANNTTVPGGVGGGGAGAGGDFAASGAGGGGASVISAGALLPVLVAGGGGGAAEGATGGDAGSAGASGGTGGGPGTATGGGSGGTTSSPYPGNGSAGGYGLGGAGGVGDDDFPPSPGGGGGGGGYYGGGGGAGSDILGDLDGGGGGGGSSYAASEVTGLTGSTATSAAPAVSLAYAVPVLGLSTQALAFSSTQQQGIASASQTITLTNSGAASLLVSGYTLAGADPDDYLVDDGCQAAVAAGSSCRIAVRFDPAATGASSATLTLLTNAAAAPAPISLSGASVAAAAPQPVTGTPGATGATGATGSRGPVGPAGPAGKVELVTCKVVTQTVVRTVAGHRRPVKVSRQQCSTKLVTGSIKFTASVARTTVARAGRTLARGQASKLGGGRWVLRLNTRRAFTAGTYTLVLSAKSHGRMLRGRTLLHIN